MKYFTDPKRCDPSSDTPFRGLIRVHLWASVVSLGLVALAQAQQNVTQDGRLLDNNPSVGSGGINEPLPNSNVSRSSDVLTRNVAGLGYFHDRVPYRANDELRLNLPSDSLFSFQAQSAPTNGDPTVPLRLQRNASVRTFNPAGASAGAGTPAWDGFVRIEDLRSPDSAAQQYSRGQAPTLAPPVPDRLAAPLQLQPAPVGTEASEATLLWASQGELTPPDPLRVRDAQQPDVLGLGLGSAPSSRAASSIAPARALGSALLWQMQPERLSGAQADMDRRVQQIESAIFQPLSSSSEPELSDEVHSALLRQRQDLLDLTPLPSTRRSGAEPADPGPVVPPTEESPLVFTPAPKPESDAESQEPPSPSAPLEQLIENLSTPLPEVESFAGKSQTRVNRLLREAEVHLATGRYFDAEGSFKTVLTLNPRHVMAQVGVMHARLGAGLFRSAAADLRRLFEEHPDLMAARYDERLMPDARRLKWAQRELEKMVEATNTVEAPLMLAYVHYQLQQTPGVAGALQRAQQRDARDPLVALLRRVWIKDDPTSSAPEKQP